MSAGKPLKDRASVADHVCDYMHEHCRSLSIDTLLTRPADALVMGLAAGMKSGRIKKADAVPALKLMATLQEKHAAALEIADEICRAALSSRKRGDLKRDRY